jgi:hypothetical protein
MALAAEREIGKDRLLPASAPWTAPARAATPACDGS